MSIKTISLLFAVIFLAGCQANVKKSDSSQTMADAEPSAPTLASSQSTTPPRTSVTQAAALPKKTMTAYESLTDKLVKQGQQALAEKRLLTPVEDNANLYFQAVLGRDPGNYSATVGIAEIVDTYTQWAWNAAQQGNYKMATRYLASARSANPEDATITQMDQRIARLKAQRAAAVARQKAAQPSAESSQKENGHAVETAVTTAPAKAGQYFLPKTLFSLSDDEIVEKMQPIIDKVKKDKNDIAIYWPNDKEARLIYQIINSRVVDFRVRAMIYHRSDYMVELQQN
ncbi:hypothetical protein GCM10009112_19940 [Marinomonas arenicola]|uniref:hypothetical protein n=1 Tax=Marinomonas TaxID=28253 RepID=UPI0010551F4F|nr:hypothetical protein [Marinomonas sp. KMM3893]